VTNTNNTYYEMGLNEIKKANELLKNHAFRQSLELYRAALWYFEELNDHEMIITIKDQIIKIAMGLKKPESLSAIPAIDLSLKPLITIDPEINEFMKAGQSSRHAGKLTLALQQYNKALERALQKNDPHLMAICLLPIAEIYLTLGKFDDALDQYQRALSLFKELDDKQAIAQTLNEIGNIYDLWGQYDISFKYYRESIKIQRQIDDPRGMGENLNDIGDLYREWKQYADALKFYQGALALHKKIAYLPGIALNLNDIGNIYEKLGEHQKALEFYSKALDIQKTLKEPKERLRGLSQTLKDMGIVARKLKKIDKALSYHKKALEIVKEARDVHYTAEYAFELGLDYKILGEKEKALQFFSQALSEYRRMLSETPQQHQKTFIKQIQPLLELIIRIELILNHPPPALWTTLQKEAHALLKILIDIKPNLYTSLKSLEPAIIPKDPKEIPYPLIKATHSPTSPPPPILSLSLQQQFHQNFSVSIQAEFETLGYQILQFINQKLEEKFNTFIEKQEARANLFFNMLFNMLNSIKNSTEFIKSRVQIIQWTLYLIQGKANLKTLKQFIKTLENLLRDQKISQQDAGSLLKTFTIALDDHLLREKLLEKSKWGQFLDFLKDLLQSSFGGGLIGGLFAKAIGELIQVIQAHI